MGADILLPCIIYVLILSNPPEIFSIVSLLVKFSGVMKTHGYEQYCLVNLNAAISYIHSLDITQLEPKKE
jgi:hypothetical protein